MYLLFDIGGTNTRIALSEDAFTFGEPTVLRTPSDFDEGMVRMREVMNTLSGGNPILAAAGGIAGPLDAARETLGAAPNLPNWRHKPVREALAGALGAECFLENDAALGGLGEAVEGAAKGYSIAAFLTIGTGFGGVRIVNGAIDRSDFGFEPGHQIIVPGGEPCGCGGAGHLESYVSGTGIERRSGKKPAHITDPAVWEEVAQYLAIGINNIIVHWSPRLVVLGHTDIMKKILLERVREHVASFLKITPPPNIVLSKLGDRGVLYGALALLKQHVG